MARHTVLKPNDFKVALYDVIGEDAEASATETGNVYVRVKIGSKWAWRIVSDPSTRTLVAVAYEIGRMQLLQVLPSAWSWETR